jgi:hypothetical protein
LPRSDLQGPVLLLELLEPRALLEPPGQEPLELPVAVVPRRGRQRIDL